MLHSRLPSPKIQNNKQYIELRNTINRSKSSASHVQISNKIQNITKNPSIKQFKSIIRVQSAFKKKIQQNQLSVLPKVTATPVKGKLHLGKVFKPEIILSNESRHNPWAAPNSITQNILNKKGLMDIINMGMVPKTADFTQLLNNKYEVIKQDKQKQFQNKGDNFFATNPNLQQEINNSQKQIYQQKDKKQAAILQQYQGKKLKKKTKKSTSTKKNKKQFFIPPQAQIFQIINQKVEKNEKYYQFLKKIKKTDDQVVFKQYIKKVEQFASKYGLKKFQFKLVLDQTRKISDALIKQQIINSKVLGISLTLKGSLKDRAYDVVKMLAVRFRFKRSRKDLFKIENIKRYFRIKRYYEEMTKKRCDFLKFKLGSFAQRQRRFVQQAQKKVGSNEKFNTQIHLIMTSGSSYQQQLSYYKLQCRNNIQLTRLFSQGPQHLILLTKQNTANLAPWFKLLKKIQGYHPIIQIITSDLPNTKVKEIDSIYYGINNQIITKIRKLSGKQNSCIYPSNLNFTLIKLCETFNAKLDSSNFWKPHLTKLLQQDQQKTFQPSFIYNIHIESIQKIQQNQDLYKSQRSSPNTVSAQLIQSEYHENLQKSKKLFTQTQIKHLIQKAKTKQLNSFELTSQYFSNKLHLKKYIFNQLKISTPLSIIFDASTKQQNILHKLSQIILENKNINKWIFKIGSKARFSRQLAFLQTDSLKILKQKKKKIVISDLDIEQVAKIMKVILIDKLELPQNSLQDSSQFLMKFIKYGGYVQSVIVDTSTQCIFGKISAAGKFQILGNYTKIYTDQVVNCAGIYPSNKITPKLIQQTKQLAQKLYKNYEIFGYITFQILIENTSKRHYFIDIIFCLQQYSSLSFVYNAILNSIKNQSQSLSILKRYKIAQSGIQQQAGKNKITTRRKIQLKKSNSASSQGSAKSVNTSMSKQKVELNKHIVYIPFIDNNGNIYKTIPQFEEALSMKPIQLLDYQNAEGLQYLYLNLKQQMPDVLSLISFSQNIKKALKYTIDGLNFLVDSGQRTNKFDKKVERRKYDCLYIHDVIWKMRQIKKSKDTIVQHQPINKI